MDGARPASDSDLARLAALLSEASSATPIERGGHLYGHPARAEDPADRLARALGDASKALLCGTIDGYVVGLALVSIDNSTANTSTGVVEELYVEPEARSVGVGEALLDSAITWCRTQGCSGMDIPALPGDRATKNLCERSGFSARLLWMHRPL